ncbi:MAG TPA: hypothetical protein PLN05_02525 [Pyrinomonadaceae bacterium]|nr:hypothetical protein [Chloracidobacterium sp.]HBE82768.1 hypothetical protein [Blastocatellia bacterium]HRJ88226.1 hypothetical protein [Pyrinomonadaceae bacterium]HRK49292.1 hypothetical protein [Pyrinomonadaceae bacterium]
MITENEAPEGNVKESTSIKDSISALGQKIIGEVEMIGGILTADPNTAAEGEFNLEVAELRGEIEDDLESSDSQPDAETDPGKATTDGE